jgi:fimbrial chaperone protein
VTIRTLRPLAAAVLVALLARPPAASAAEVQVDPVLIELSPATRSASITLRNTGGEPSRFEVGVRAWEQSQTGEMRVAPTDDVLVYPPILSLAPGEARLLRVGVAPKGGFGSAEGSYRVFIEELPPPTKPGEAAQVRILSRLTIPVFLAPSRAVERAVLAGLAVSGREARFTLRNEGTLRLRTSSLKLTALGAGGAVLSQLELPAWYVLAGGVRAYQAVLPPERCAEVRTVEVTAALERQTLRAKAAAPGGVCAPR